MPTERPRDRFNDITRNIDSIFRYVDGLSQLTFLADPKTVDALERCLGRISEAAVKLGQTADALEPSQPWGDIRGLGNRLRHEYDTIDRVEIWRIVQEDLASLRLACDRIVQRWESRG